MKKAIIVLFVVLGFVFLTSMITHHSTDRSSPPTKKEAAAGKPIPPNVMKIAERSCVKCHTDGGNDMALMHLNLSNWDNYTSKKQAKKAKAMCKMVSREKMPPKSFNEKHPDAAPTKEEEKIICDWATSIRTMQK